MEKYINQFHTPTCTWHKDAHWEYRKHKQLKEILQVAQNTMEIPGGQQKLMARQWC